MKKLFKKSISCIVAVLMVLSSMPFTALTANAALVKQDIAVWDAANVTTATPGTGTKFTHTDSSTNVSINGVHWGSASKADGNGYVTFNNATLSSEAGFASLNIKGDVWTFSSKFATTGSGLDDQNTQQTTNDNSTIFGIGTATTRNYSPSGAVKTSGMAADLVNITKNGNIYLAGSSTSSGTVANVLSSSADDAKILTVAYDNGNLTISLDGTTAYTGTVDTALFSQGVSNFFIGTSAQVYAGGKAPYYGLTNDGYYTYGTHLYSLSASVSYDPTNVPPSANATTVKTALDNDTYKTTYSDYTNSSLTNTTGYMQGIIKATSWQNVDTQFTFEASNTDTIRMHTLENAVGVYTGAGSVVFPIVLEHVKTANGTNIERNIGFDHVSLNNGGNFAFGNSTWKRCNSYTDWGDNSDNTHDFSSLSNGNVARDESSGNGRFGVNEQKLWKNNITYSGTISDSTYYDELSSATLNLQADYTIHWRNNRWDSWKWSNASNFNTNINTNSSMYVINFAPLKNIMTSNEFESNFYNIYNNRAKYNETERENYFSVMADIVNFDLSTKTMTTENEVSAVAREIKGLVDRYNQYKSPTSLGNTVTFVNASGSTIESRFVQNGNAIGAFPENTGVVRGDFDNHYTYTWDTTLTPESTVDSDITIREKENGAHCSGGTATCVNRAICSVCGNQYGSVNANNHINTRTVDAKASTCTEAGWEAYTYCDDCNKVVGEKVDLPLARHDYEVTKKDDTYHTYNCKNCTDSYDEAHDWGEYVVTTPATCTGNAVETATCTVAGCGATTSREVADTALDHDYQYAELDADNHTVTCSRCDYSAQAPHRFDENNTCTDCGYVKVTIDTTAYDNAVAEYEEIIGAGDYAEKYTEASRTAYQEAVEAAKRDSFATKEEVDAAVAAILSAKTKLVYAKADVNVYIAREGVEPVLVETISKNYGETADINVADKLSAGEQILKWVIETQDTKVNTKLATTDTTVSMVVTEPADVYVHIATEKSTEAVQYSKVSFISKNGAVSFVKYVPAGTTLYTNTVDGVEIPFYEFKNWDKASVTADGNDIEVKAVYEFIGTVDDKCNVHYEGFENGVKEYTYDSFVYLFGAEDKTLALSTDGTVENIITYLNENAFYAPHTKDIYVIVVDSQQPSIGITGSYASSTDTKKTAAFNCKFFLPAGCTVVEYGLTATSSTGKSIKIKAEAASARGEYCVKVSMDKTSTVTSVEGVAYLTYMDADNNLQTIHSTSVTQNLL